jgi:hypothetical protein
VNITTDQPRAALDWRDLPGLAFIGATLYGDDDEVLPGSHADDARSIWARLFWPLWVQLDDGHRARLRTILAPVSEEFERAIADVERRAQLQPLDRALVDLEHDGERSARPLAP